MTAKLAVLGKIARQVYEAIELFNRGGRDATRRRLAAYMLRGQMPVGESERDAAQGEMIAIVNIGLSELKRKKLVRQVIDAWVTC